MEEIFDNFEDMEGTDEHGDVHFGGVEDTEVETEEGLNVYDRLIAVDSMLEIMNINFRALAAHNVRNFHFASLEMAYMFYNWYAQAKGFVVRKSKVTRNKNGEIVMQAFVCNRQGYREQRGLTIGKRKRQTKPETRCGCEAEIRVCLVEQVGRWCVTCFSDVHNHDLLDDMHLGLMPAYKTMTDADIRKMNNLLKVGRNTPHVGRSFASQSSRFQKVRFHGREMGSKISRQRWMQSSDVRAALMYLRGLVSNDPAMFWRHTVDEEGRLQHLFWCDGTSQLDYKVFGDVLAFDTTYGKSKYLYPLVVLSGVNHHNQTTIFASAIIADETEETYMWLLKQFMVAMKGKSPELVITDGDIAMKNAISRMFPNAYHRLCARYLLRCATSNVGDPRMIVQFKKCMLADYEVHKFQSKWDEMVAEFGLQDHSWIRDIYEKRRMWATAYIRGRCFSGFRITSRCEGLYAQIGRIVRSCHNLSDFLQHFHHCLDDLRHKEVVADFKSVHGEPVLQTNLKALERSASRVFTREVFMLFRPMLARGSTMMVVGCRETASHPIYIVSKYDQPNREWYVSFYSPTFQLKCSCLRMESLGIPCDHIVCVMVYLDIDEMPTCLVLKRWTKCAKKIVKGTFDEGNLIWDSTLMARYRSLLDMCRQMCNLSCRSNEDFNDTREMVRHQIEMLGAMNEGKTDEDDNENCVPLEDDDEVNFYNDDDNIDFDKFNMNDVERHTQSNVDGGDGYLGHGFRVKQEHLPEY